MAKAGGLRYVWTGRARQLRAWQRFCLSRNHSLSPTSESRSMPSKILIVVHQEHSDPGKVGAFLAARGYALDRRCPNLGDPLPDRLGDYAAAVVFGGPMSANDDHLPGIRAELAWLERTALPGGCPLLGICLGAQEIAKVLGARVCGHPEGLVEIGYTEVRPTAQGGDFLARPTQFYQWHAETFDIPWGAIHLAANGAFEGQAFRWGERVWGIEFHPEMTRAMVDRWCSSEGGRPKLTLPGAQSHADQLAGYDRHAAGSDRWLAWFLDERLLAPARAAAAAAD